MVGQPLPSFLLSLDPTPTPVQQDRSGWTHARLQVASTAAGKTHSFAGSNPQNLQGPLTQRDKISQTPDGWRLLTYGRGEERNHFRLLPIIVKSQVPDSRIQILDEAGLVTRWGDDPPRLALGSLQAPCFLGQEPSSIQQLHKIKLEVQRKHT